MVLCFFLFYSLLTGILTGLGIEVTSVSTDYSKMTTRIIGPHPVWLFFGPYSFILSCRALTDSALCVSRLDLRPGGDRLETESTVFWDRISFVPRHKLWSHWDRIEFQDYVEQYRNDCTWIILQSACSTSLDVCIELPSHCRSISLRYRWFTLISRRPG